MNKNNLKIKRTASGDLRIKDVGQEVLLSGWVHRSRDHGGLIFIDLRDRSGIVQVVFDPKNKEAFNIAKTLRSEYVINILGKVRKRPEGTENPNLSTGEVEVVAEKVEIINPSKTPPISIAEESETQELVRLKYRYLDLRREKMKENLILRHKMTKAVRDFLDKEGFLEIETPMLIKSTPEGARDFLVPSRFYPGKFFALPQSPQLFKQLLMVSGIEKYFQIVRCFRDEDLRADRQPEFTQIDMEMSFVEEDGIMEVVERMLKYIFEKVLSLNLDIPFPRITFMEAKERFGTDKPDLRFGLELVEVSEIVANSQFKVFTSALAEGGIVKGINIKGRSSFSRKDLDDLTNLAIRLGAKGMAWIVVEDELKSPILKFFNEEEIKKLTSKMRAEKGDVLIFIADKKEKTNKVLCSLREKLGKQLNLIPEDSYKFAWIVDFPLLQYSEQEKRLVSYHHPFTAPKDEDLTYLATSPERVRAKAYDLVLNGCEVAGGSVRIHKPSLQKRMFEILKLSPQEIEEKFGFLLEAFEYGAPPHAGIAFGFDRLVMILAKENTIRDVIPFPKTQTGLCPLTGAPYEAAEEQLRELGIKIISSKINPSKGGINNAKFYPEFWLSDIG